MLAIFKAFKIRGRHADDKSGKFNEAPVKNEFRISFYPGGFNLVLIDLAKNSYMTIEKVIINANSNGNVSGSNEKYNVRIVYEADGRTINQVFINEINTPIELEYLGEASLMEKVNAEIRNQYIIGAFKNNGEIRAYIGEGYFAPLEVDFAFMKIREKIKELTYFDYPNDDNRTLILTVSFFKNTSIKSHIEIENTVFDLDTIKIVVEGLYKNKQRI